MADIYLPSTSLVQLHKVGKRPLSEVTEGILVPGVVRLARECIVGWGPVSVYLSPEAARLKRFPSACERRATRREVKSDMPGDAQLGYVGCEGQVLCDVNQGRTCRTCELQSDGLRPR